MAQDPISRFQSTYMSYGDRLGEWMYGFIMVAVVVGIVGGFSEIILNTAPGYTRLYLTIYMLILTFGVNIAWGLIDGVTVIYGGLTDRADLEEVLEKLKKDRTNRELRDKVLDSLEDSSTMYLPDEEKEKLVDRVIDEAPEAPKTYYLSKDDRNTLIAIASCDILAVIPVMLPYVLLGFGRVPTMLARLIASIAIGYLVFLYAEHTGRNKWLAGGIFVILTAVMMAITYYFGW
jgi:VIT1/CCC1 family predicted Fe2+/Mn2+ transporter